MSGRAFVVRFWFIASTFVGGLATTAPALAQCVGVWNNPGAFGPTPRSGHAMAFDSARNRIVLFGGTTAGVRKGDTWEWDGTSWTLKSNTGPSPRFFHSMAYDVARGKTVLCGGFDTTFRHDTWEWDGNAWTMISNAGPSPRFFLTLAYDASRNHVVLFGGFDGLAKNDTWEWNGSVWTPVVGTTPTIRYGHGMAYDSNRGRMVLYGGTAPSTPTLGDTWEYVFPNWTQVCTAGCPPRYNMAMSYDSTRRLVILDGGFDTTYRNDAWTWNGSQWNWMGPGSPSARSLPASANFPPAGHTILFGGKDGTGDLGDTWSVIGPGPAVISQQPLSAVVNTGHPVSFTVSVAGPGPFSYQWRRNAVNLVDGGAILGANAPTLNINPATLADVAAYDCVITNPCGVNRSDPAAPAVQPCLADLNLDTHVNGLDVPVLVNLLLNANDCP